MSYRDDLIRRFQQDGTWEQLTAEQQQRFQNLTDDQIRRMMVLEDQWNMSDEKAIGVFGQMSLVQAISAFGGALVEHRGESAGRLSKAGKLLAEFLLELREKGLSTDDVAAGLEKLSPLVVAALTTVYLRTKE